MTKEKLKKRTKHFALKIINLVENLPEIKAGRTWKPDNSIRNFGYGKLPGSMQSQK